MRFASPSPVSSRPSRLGLAVAALLVFAAVAGPAAALPGVEVDPGAEAKLDPVLRAEIEAQLAKQEQVEASLLSPAAVAERERSKSAYGGLGDDEARELFLAEFGSFVERSGQPPVDAARVERYLSDFVAVLTAPGEAPPSSPVPGESPDAPDQGPSLDEPQIDVEPPSPGVSPQLVESALPLRAVDEGGEKAPLDLELRWTEKGGFEPANPLVDSSLPAELGEGIRVGNGAGVGLRLRGADTDAKAVRVTESALLYANAGADRDLLVSAEPTGVKLSTQIRTPAAAAQAESWALDLSEGARLERAADGSALIRRDEELLARIAAPSAFDAQGRSVPAALRVDGNSVELSLEAGDWAFPIVLDPLVESYPTGSFGTGVWPAFEPNGGPFHTCPSSDPFCAWFGGNLAISAPYDEGSYPAWASGEKRWTLPNGTSNPDATTAWVESASFGGASFSGNGAQPATPYFYAGIWNTRTNAFNDVFTRLGNQSFGATTVTIPRAAAVPGAGDDGQQVRFGLADFSSATTTHSAAATAQAGSATIALEDPEAPSQTISNEGQLGQWKKENDTLSFAVASSDPGLGVLVQRFWWPTTAEDSNSYAFEGQPSLYKLMDKPGQVPGSPGTNCTGGRMAPCPQSVSAQTFTKVVDATVSEGRHDVWVHTFDPLIWGHLASATRQVRIDRSAPEIELTGSLAEAPDGKLDAKSYQLTVKATDGSTESPDQERSGIKDLKLYLDGNLVPAPAQISNQSCPASSCEGEISYALDATALSSGAHTLRIEATDQLGQKRTKHLDLAVDGLAGVILTPKRGDTTARQLGLSAERQDAGMTHVEFQYRRPGVSGSAWSAIPIAQLTVDSSGNHPIDTWLPLESSGKSPPVSWDVPPTAGIGGTDGAINLRAHFKGASGPQAVAGDSPALWWRLGESADEAAASDSSGNDRSGTYIGRFESLPMAIDDGAPSGAADDGAVELSGDATKAQYIRSTYQPYASGSERLFMGWARRASANSKDVLIGGQDPALGSDTPALTIGDGAAFPSSTIRWAPRGGSSLVADWANAAPAAGQWFHWALAYNASTGIAELLVNNASKGARSIGNGGPTSDYALPAATFTAGATYSGATPVDLFHGALDEVVVETGPFSAPDTLAARVASHYSGLERGFSQVVPVTLDRDTTTSKHASAPIGPGTVDLLTGNFSVSADDVSIDAWGSDLTVSRTFNSRAPSQDFWSVFGPGWVASLPVDAAAADYVQLKKTGPPGDEAAQLKVISSDSTEILFSRSGDRYLPETLYADLQLRKQGEQFVLEEIDGSRTTFYEHAPGQPYPPLKVRQTGQASQNTTRFGYETVVNPRPTFAVAPAPAGVACTSTDSQGRYQLLASPPRGCRWLTFHYSPGVPAPPQGTYGAFSTRLDRITFHAWKPDDPAATAVDVARYEYDHWGRLHGAWDPRTASATSCGGPCQALKATYEYDNQQALPAGHLSQVKPAGENAWNLAYKAAASGVDPSTGRLASVSRAIPGSGTATETVVYDVPLTTGAGGPYAMGPGDVDDWGQADLPATATAIFPPDQVPSGDPPSSWTRATVHYMNRNGDLVNVASEGENPDSSDDEISTTEYGPHRMAISELSAANRLRSFQSGAPSADVLETDRDYNADGTELLEEWGPQHQILRDDGTWTAVQARQHTAYSYDEGAPSGKDYHLPTTVSSGARIVGQSSDVDVRTTTTAYNWALRQPTATTIDPGSSPHLNLTNKVFYDQATGLPTETRRPKANANGTDAHTTKIIYYTAGAHPSDSACGNRPEWANLPCKELPGGQPSGPAPDLPITVYEGYNIWSQPTSVRDDAPSASDRITTSSYDSAGRPSGSQISGGQGTALPATATSYSSTTGRIVATGDGTRTITRGYDAIGRQTSYTDADGVTSTTSYDLLGRPILTYDGKGFTSFDYSTQSGRLTEMDVMGVGTFEASYDADGRVVTEYLPNELRVVNLYDAAGEHYSRNYYKSGCSSACEVMAFAALHSVHGQVLQEASFEDPGWATISEYDQYSYDAASRLTRAYNWMEGSGCTRRDYEYDANSNRTAFESVSPLIGGDCDTSGAGTTTTQTLDEADRITDAGYSYDEYGRTLTVPAADAGGQQLASTYFTNDRIHTLVQNGTTQTFLLDPIDRARVRTTNGQPDEVYHYSDDSDAPSWIDEGGSNGDFSRFASSIGGSLSAVQRGNSGGSTGIAYQITNIHGDVRAETNSGGAIAGVYAADEFGVPQSDIPGSGYGWLGGKERVTQLASGAISMGQRIYLPVLGRFLQVDPVEGGSANDYDYANQDPLNLYDLDGRQIDLTDVLGGLPTLLPITGQTKAARGLLRVGRAAIRTAKRGIVRAVRTVSRMARAAGGFVQRAVRFVKRKVSELLGNVDVRCAAAWVLAAFGTGEIIVGGSISATGLGVALAVDGAINVATGAKGITEKC